MKFFSVSKIRCFIFLSFLLALISSHVQSQGIYQLWGTTYEGGPDDIGSIFSADSSGGHLTGRHSFKFISYGAHPHASLTEYNGKLYGMADPALSQSDKAVLFEYDPVTGVSVPKVYIKAQALDAGGLTVYNNQLYGTISPEGTGSAALFKYDPAINVYTKLLDFVDSTGMHPVGKLAIFNNKMYGLTSSGGKTGGGVLYEYDPQTNIYTRKADLSDVDGAAAYGGLAVYGNKLYGMTWAGSNSPGVLFEYDPIANIIVKKIALTTADGSLPQGGMVVYNDKLWGLTTQGGSNNAGVLFQYDPSTNVYTKKIDLSTATGSVPTGDLIVYGDKLLGLTSRGGLHDQGTLFEYDPLANTYAKRVDFFDLDGRYPGSTLTLMNSTVYGITDDGGSAAGGVVFEYNPITFQYTKKIDMASTNGDFPNGSLTYFGKSLYGVTDGGGPKGTGVLYKYDLTTGLISPEVNFDTLNGSYPMGDLIAYDEKLYGLTYGGGAYGKGVLFSYAPGTKTYSKLIDFDSLNGGFFYDLPYLGFESPHNLQYTDNLTFYNNKLYGTTQSCGLHNAGVLFEYDPVSGVFTKKIDFDSATGEGPTGALLAVNDKFYGVTIWGGAYDEGVLFEYDPTTNIYTKKLDFHSPDSFGGDGYLSLFNNKIYGLSTWGGAGDNGLIFEYDPATNVYQNKISFTPGMGTQPGGGMLLRNQLFYGTTQYGGAFDKGTLFEYSPVTNAYVKKADFDSTNTGSTPFDSQLISIPAQVASGVIGSCTDLPVFNIDNSNNNAWQAITNEAGDAIAEINPNGNNLGNVTASLYVQNNPVRNAAGLQYLNRSITINVQNQPAAGQPVGVRLYISKAEFDDLVNTPGSGISSINDLSVYKSENTCSSVIGSDVVKLNTTAAEWGVNYVLTTQVTSFSTFHFSTANNAPLPITLLGFTASKKSKTSIQLDWQTSVETNSSHFAIERSTNGNLFTFIGTVPAAGNSSIKKEYQYIDADIPSAATLYYRLKMTDRDGKSKYSKIAKLSFANTPGVRISPNPVQNTLAIAGADQFKQARIIDANGRTIRQLTLMPGKQYDVRDLTRGVYTLHFANDRDVMVLRFLKL